MPPITGYKWIRDDWNSCKGSDTPWEIGVWKEASGELKLCENGYHACRTAYQSLEYIYDNCLVIVEAEDLQDSDNKFVARRMRVIAELPTKEIMVKFAIACAKHVLYLYERKFTSDDRPRKAIDAAADAAAHGAYAAAYAAADDDDDAAAAAASNAAWAAADASDGCIKEKKWQEQKFAQIVNKYQELNAIRGI